MTKAPLKFRLAAQSVCFDAESSCQPTAVSLK
jgi:hypothetical protein